MDAVISTSPEAARYLDVPYHVIMHGVDLERFCPAEDRTAEWAKTGLPGRYGIGVFGRIRHQKGTVLFAEAMCTLLPKFPDATAVVIGLATPENQGYADAIRQRVAEAGIADRFVFLGELPSAEIPSWFARLLIHVAPQRWEGFGLTPLESMASGTAVVATHAGVFASLVADEKTGLLVETGNLSPLITALERLMADPALAETMGAAGRRHVEERFSIAGEARVIDEVYDAVWKSEISRV